MINPPSEHRFPAPSSKKCLEFVFNPLEPSCFVFIQFQWKEAAFSQFHRNINSHDPIMGYSVRTKQHRYTEWVAFDKIHFRANFSHVHARELYVHATDPDEFHNVAEVTSCSATIESLSQLLRAGWRKAQADYLARAASE